MVFFVRSRILEDDFVEKEGGFRIRGSKRLGLDIPGFFLVGSVFFDRRRRRPAWWFAAEVGDR